LAGSTNGKRRATVFRPYGADSKEQTMAALGIILIIAGGIVAWGVDAAVDGFDLQAIGYILMAGGAIALLVAAIQAAGWMSRSNRQMRTERHVSADGNHLVEETETH
jgi:hypothetical protein